MFDTIIFLEAMGTSANGAWAATREVLWPAGIAAGFIKIDESEF